MTHTPRIDRHEDDGTTTPMMLVEIGLLDWLHGRIAELEAALVESTDEGAELRSAIAALRARLAEAGEALPFSVAFPSAQTRPVTSIGLADEAFSERAFEVTIMTMPPRWVNPVHEENGRL